LVFEKLSVSFFDPMNYRFSFRLS